MADSLIPPGARELAIAAAREAGAILRERLLQPRDVQFKGTVDLVTDADRASEALIAGKIREAFPDHRLIGEEGGGGATLNGVPLRVTDEAELIRSLLATGFPYDLARRAESDALWDAFNNRVQ